MRLCVEREIYNEYLILFKTKKAKWLMFTTMAL